MQFVKAAVIGREVLRSTVVRSGFLDEQDCLFGMEWAEECLLMTTSGQRQSLFKDHVVFSREMLTIVAKGNEIVGRSIGFINELKIGHEECFVACLAS